MNKDLNVNKENDVNDSNDYTRNIQKNIELPINRQSFRNIPLKPIKHILKAYYKGEISNAACIDVRNLLLDIIGYLAEETVKEFENYNIMRLKQGLPPLKRLNSFVFREVRDRFFKSIGVVNMGEVGKCNGSLLCLGDDIQKQEKEDIIKNATEVIKDG